MKLIDVECAHVEELAGVLRLRLIVTCHQGIEVEADEERLVVHDEVAAAGHLDAATPRNERERDEVDGRLLDRVVAHVRHIAEEMARHAVDAAHLLDAESPRLKKLGGGVVDLLRPLLESIRNDDGGEGVLRTLEHLVPLVFVPPQHLWLVGLVGLKDGAAAGVVSEECRGVNLCRPGKADGLAGEGHRHITCHPIGREPANHKNLLLPILDGVGVRVEERRRDLVVVPQLAVRQPLDRHPRGVERLQLVDGAVRAGDDLAVGVAPEEQLRHGPLFPLKRRHPVVGLVVQQFVEVLVLGDLLAAAGEAAVEVHRQAGDRLRKHPDAGEDGTALQARLGADGNAGRRLPSVPNLLKDSGQIAPVLDDFKDCFVGLIHL